MVSEFLLLREKTELFPSGDSYDISLGNNDPNEHITLVFVVISFNNQLEWMDLANED